MFVVKYAVKRTTKLRSSPFLSGPYKSTSFGRLSRTTRRWSKGPGANSTSPRSAGLVPWLEKISRIEIPRTRPGLIGEHGIYMDL